jgi:hypothetical protein
MNPHGAYRERAEQAGAEVRRWREAADRIATGRLLTFLAFVAGWVVSRTALPLAGLALLVAVGAAAGFVRLLLRHSHARRKIVWHETVEALNRESEARIERDWDGIREPHSEPPEAHAFADDLDVLGRHSLLHLIGGASTRPGLETLSAWLLHPADPEEIESRQAAIRELAADLDFREELWVRSTLAGPVSASEVESLVQWAEEPTWLLERTPTRLAGRLLPLFTVATVLSHVFGLIPYLWVLTLSASAWVNRGVSQAILKDFVRLSIGERGLHRYGEIIGGISRYHFEAPRIRTLLEGLRAGTIAPPEALDRLFRWVDVAESRRNFFHPLLNLVFHWDLRVMQGLERWKERHGAELRGWLRTLGEVDALTGLAALAHAHPEWCFPSVRTRGDSRLIIESLGHPLLPPRSCVHNDVELGPPGTFLLVTGSNMSGKSTLLRAIGLNVVLAGAGGPVSAASMRMPLVDLRTSMRVRDALDEGVSYFMAGLRRLKGVVDAADAATDGRPVLYLLDEILQGTNTAERQIAARRVIRHLLERPAIGAVTTHDLTLADTEDLAERSRPVHFRDTPGTAEEPLIFDYLLRPGIATSTNALKLVELMGLGEAD